MRIRWLESAVRTLHSSLRRIKDENPEMARDIAARIRLSVERLQEFPQSGRIGRTPGTREVVNPRLPYIVVYRGYGHGGADTTGKTFDADDPMTADKKKREDLNRRIREAQAYFKSLAPPEISLSEELLEDRREEAEREEQEDS